MHIYDNMKYCLDCGCENIDDAQFCRNCGAKLNGEVAQATQDVEKVKTSPPANDISAHPIIQKLFYKTDRITGELRFAKAKTISIGVFVLMFIFALTVASPGDPLLVIFIVAVIFALIFAVPLYVLGYIVSLIIERLSQ